MYFAGRNGEEVLDPHIGLDYHLTKALVGVSKRSLPYAIVYFIIRGIWNRATVESTFVDLCLKFQPSGALKHDMII
ncbi:hypothetical protein J6590_059099 [Homalodisca vitripennis]|nr:hypothetical protein J6590_059099 [Homalodisca vitripennis]